jgi:TonB family protein
MSRFPLLALSVIAVSLFLTLRNSAEQTVADANTPQTGVVLTKLDNPVYPSLALQARISGDVNLVVRVRQDGTVESVEVISGHPMLKEAALYSAKRSEFVCHGCSEALTTYSLVYTFGLTKEKCCEATEGSADTETRSSQNDLALGSFNPSITLPSSLIRRVFAIRALM